MAKRKGPRNRRGQAMPEYAFIVIVVILVVGGFIAYLRTTSDADKPLGNAPKTSFDRFKAAVGNEAIPSGPASTTGGTQPGTGGTEQNCGCPPLTACPGMDISVCP